MREGESLRCHSLPIRWSGFLAFAIRVESYVMVKNPRMETRCTTISRELAFASATQGRPSAVNQTIARRILSTLEIGNASPALANFLKLLLIDFSRHKVT